MRDAMIVAAARTPIGRMTKGSLARERPDDLVAQVIQHVLRAVPQLAPSDVDDLLLGCGSPGGEQGFNMARVVAVLLGLDEVPGCTVTRYCASSVQTTRMAMHAIRAGEGDVFLSAGVESCSSYAKGEADSLPGTMNPLFDEARERSAAAAEATPEGWEDPRAHGLFPDVYIDMGQTAENVAALHDVTRADMDAYALLSQQRTAAAVDSGFWARDLVPYRRADGTVVNRDDCPRPDTTLDALAGLRPVFRPGGRSTAGNSCPLNDGAAALLVMSDSKARDLGVTPLARIVATAVSALSPEIMGLGPVEATHRVLETAGMSLGDIDLFELNEAFAAQVLPCQDQLGIPIDRLNVHGGAIAIGHPFGATGARTSSTVINALSSRDKEIGLQTMCVGGGQGMAMILERLS
ncbi:acetyl-CoA C-acetyltransferase [Saccharopolyspora elongata]|uniref:Acetyl-CoA C-acetyltransferase n=1 Tax=Saccharopolyspora elongata TaxID=2530387 RepID=A0A4R4XRL9_9PSEU|nr:acetyl-CoA C-acetyltransferase [Saccharopolyspora elongata]TDD34108.1 acetyl-CoA C-acetyltransferase [Saccharopolyspora elongata]